MTSPTLLEPLCYDEVASTLGYDPLTETAAFSAIAADPWTGKLEDLPERYGFSDEKEKDESDKVKPDRPTNTKVAGIKRVAAALAK